MEISKKTIQGLKKAGWYEGRKIDISENMEFLEERGFDIFESAKNFMEEFGELFINIEKTWSDGLTEITKHDTHIKLVIGILDNSCFGLDDYIDYDGKTIDESIIPIAKLYDGEIRLYITESGKLYRDTGWIGDTVWEAWDNIISQNGGRYWKEIRY